MTQIAGKRALVTGGNRGIGRAIAVALSRAGAHVAVNYRERIHEAEATLQEIASSGGRAMIVRADVRQRGEVDRMIEEVRRELGGVDILVNNAGIATPRAIDAVTEADWNDTVNANLTSAFQVTQAVLPEMRARGWGRIVFISSTAAQVGGIVGPHYAASKAGLYGLMHYYAAHLAPEGVTANAVAPALIETEMVTSNMNARPDRIPVGRFGRVDEVASAVLLLVENAYMTGQTLQVNGGVYLT